VGTCLCASVRVGLQFVCIIRACAFAWANSCGGQPIWYFFVHLNLFHLPFRPLNAAGSKLWLCCLYDFV
jgi:hypothetical protein